MPTTEQQSLVPDATERVGEAMAYFKSMLRVIERRYHKKTWGYTAGTIRGLLYVESILELGGEETFYSEIATKVAEYEDGDTLVYAPGAFQPHMDEGYMQGIARAWELATDPEAELPERMYGVEV